MFPPYNSQSRPSSQLHSNGRPASTPPQAMSNPGMQIQRPMFNPQGSITPNTPRFPFQGPQNPNSQMNNGFPQMPGQFFAQNAVNPAQFFNPSVNFGLPNGQNLMQTVNQLLQLQMQLQLQMGMPGIPNVGVQNPAFNGNVQFAHANGATQQPMNANFSNQSRQGNAPPMNANFSNQSQQGNAPPMNANFLNQSQHGNAPPMNANFLNQSQQGNAPPMNAFGMARPHLNQSSLNHPDAAKSQGDLGHAARVNTNGNWKSSPNNNFKRNQRHDAPHTGFRKAMPQSVQNVKRNFNNHNDSPRKGHNTGGTENSSTKQNQNEKKRPLPLLYTEQEVRQWREHRRKNYPSKANIEKKSQKLAETEDNARLRRQQLKEILAKQAELGCEIAEIPSSYLTDLEKPGHERENRRPLSKNEKFQNKFNKRGRFGQKNKFSKRQKFENLNSSNTQEPNDDHSREQKLENRSSASQSKREPTLLQKLLGADIRRDKHHLLQVFRFMVANNFFIEHPEKPLKFPSVIVKEELGNQNVAIDQVSPIEQPFDNDEDKECQEVTDLCKGKEHIGSTQVEEHQEEGEIID